MLLWRVENSGLVALEKQRLDNEDRLEEWIASDASLLGLDVLIIARQLRTPTGGRIDLLAIDQQGNLLILELKRDKTPREVVAQALDYASWVAGLLPAKIEELSHDSLKKPLSDAFHEHFDTYLPDVLNNDHQILIVASELDDSSERIVQYLSARHSLNINVVFFTCFRQGKREFVGRAWLLDPEEVEQRSEGRRAAQWSGYWYVNVGECEWRNWEDFVKYGFLSAGWGRKYTEPLRKLEVGGSVFAYMRGLGYVGYGSVVQESCPAKDFIPKGAKKSVLDLPLRQHASLNPGLFCVIIK